MPIDNIKKTRVLVPAITAALVLMMGPAMLSTGAFAVGPTSTTRDGGLHFVGSPDLRVNSDGSLTAKGEVAGAGGGGTATLSADVTATLGCVNRGGNEPSGLQDEDTDVTGSDDFTTRNGRGTFTVTTDEVTVEDFDFSCPPGQARETLVSVEYSNIVLTIEAQTGTITATFPDQET
jgi:hypothetical protein